MPQCSTFASSAAVTDHRVPVATALRTLEHFLMHVACAGATIYPVQGVTEIRIQESRRTFATSVVVMAALVLDVTGWLSPARPLMHAGCAMEMANRASGVMACCSAAELSTRAVSAVAAQKAASTARTLTVLAMWGARLWRMLAVCAMAPATHALGVTASRTAGSCSINVMFVADSPHVQGAMVSQTVASKSISVESVAAKAVVVGPQWPVAAQITA